MTAHDKHKRPITPGTRVNAVHFGEHHELEVDRTSEEHGHHFVHGRVRVKIPAAAVAVIDGPASAGHTATTEHSGEHGTGKPAHRGTKG